MIKRPEILAPCGTMEAFEAALCAGADAVYLAGHKFGARAFAGNFEEGALLSVLERAHLFGMKVYLTVNTLFKNSETGLLYNYIKPLYEAGLDAVLVQDLGVFSVLRRELPDLPIHVSTQMNITGLAGIRLLSEMGAERIVLDREISLTELRSIRENTDMELETFVHGAMCFSYSGRCLISSVAGGRSGNRGRCAQPCRKLYSHDGEESYIMSMKDMCALRYAPELISLGIDSLKLEGRMKNAYYVAAVVDAYREIADDVMNGRFSLERALYLEERLAEVFSRGGFSSGYLTTNEKNNNDIAAASLMTGMRQGHSGICIGRVDKADGKGRVNIYLDKALHEGDELLIEGAEGDIRLTSNKHGKIGEKVILNAPDTRHLKNGMKVRRLKNIDIIHDIDECLSRGPERIKVNMEFVLRKDENAVLTISTISDQRELNYRYIITGEKAEKASKQPVTDQNIREKLGRLGDSEFELEKLIIHNDNESFFRMSELNNMRREALSGLRNEIVRGYIDKLNRREIHGFRQDKPSAAPEGAYSDVNINTGIKKTAESNPAEEELYIFITTTEQLCEVLDADILNNYKTENVRIYIDTAYDIDKTSAFSAFEMLVSRELKLYLALPYISRGEEAFKEKYGSLYDECEGLYIRNIDDLGWIYEEINKEVICQRKILLAASLYAYNNEALKTLARLIPGAEFESPFELNRREIEAMSYPDRSPVLYTYGRLPLMVTAALVREDRDLIIRDDKLNSFFIKSAGDLCYNVILNQAPVCLFGKTQGFRSRKIEFSNEASGEVRQVLEELFRADSEKGKYSPTFRFTNGHFARGIE